MLWVKIADRHGEILIEKKLTGIPIKELVIIEAAIKYYNDPSPCIIRRTAVMKVIYAEIENMLEPFVSISPVSLDDLPKRFLHLTELPDGARQIYIRHS